MPTVSISDKTISCKTGESLYQVLLRGGIAVNAPCGGNGTCGKCTVWIEGIGAVKACTYRITSDITVSTHIREQKIASKGYLRQVTADNKSPCIAVDIGTTTVVAYLLLDGNIIDIESALNAQKPYGDDVITRIKYTMDNPDGTNNLHRLITKQIEDMVSILCERNGVLTGDIAIAGNTTMLHLYADISPASIGVAPFTPAFTETRIIGNTTLLPGISGYVGADTVAAILASGMHLSEEKSLLIDIGTNGEIALGSRDGIYTCAAAAGPAFEGAGISCGVGGISGAINSVKIGDGITFTTIDSAPPVGICGSGILDAAAEMLKAELVDETGFFEDGILQITDDIYINDKDIRQIQLAKAAIAAGIATILKDTGLDINEIKTCYLAGGFGSFLNKDSAVAIGLLPMQLKDNIKVIGNAAGMGAVLWQTNDTCRKEAQAIKRMTSYIELSGSKTFNDAFMECMMF